MRVAVVGGAGHIGLPLSLLLADRGFSVDILDKDAKKLEQLQKGIFPFLERGGPELLERCKDKPTLQFTSDSSIVSKAECIILTIGTPIDEHLNPTMHEVMSCIELLKPHCHDGQIVILRSTLFPGTTERIAAQLADAGLRMGVCFCPERIAQGYAVEELLQLPQIISGTSPEAIEIAAKLFGTFGVELIELEVIEAEIAKLFLNAWRYIHFATANQFYVLAEERGLDFAKIRQACCYRYPRAGSMPNSGLTAGPCLFKDSMVLASFARHSSSLCHAAMLINETMPEVIVAKAKEKGSLRGTRVGLLGMAFKGGSDDVRDSLAFKVRRLLNYEGASVLCTDVLVASHDFFSLEEAMACSVVILTCPHAEYKHLKFEERQHVIDCWGMWAPHSLKIRRPLAATPLTVRTSESKKRFLVTGCNNLLGSHLVLGLMSYGHEVWAVDQDRFCCIADEHLAKFASQLTYRQLTDTKSLQDCLIENSIQIVIAAFALTSSAFGDNSESPQASPASLMAYLRNVCTAVEACVAARHSGNTLERLVLVSSSEVFNPPPAAPPCSEADLATSSQPKSLSGTQAVAGESLVRAAWEEHSLPYVIVRPFHPVGVNLSTADSIRAGGGGSCGDPLLDYLLRQAVDGHRMHLPALGTQMWHATAINDIVEAIARCSLDTRALNSDFNIGSDPDAGLSVHALAHIVWSKARPGEDFPEPELPAHANPQSNWLFPSVRKARSLLGIDCSTSLEVVIDELLPSVQAV